MVVVFKHYDENVLRKMTGVQEMGGKSSSVSVSLCQTDCGLNVVLAYESNAYVTEITKCKEIQRVHMPGYLHLTL